MEKHQKLGLALIAAGCALAAFCGLGLYYVNQGDTMPAMAGTTAAPAGTLVPTAEPTAAPNAAPVLTLIGDDPLFYPAQPGGYEDPGCTAIDDRDGDITAKIECAADVNTFHTGEGSVTYSVTDSEGLGSTITRRVIVTAADRPDTVTPEAGTVYLTFDDGPSANTEHLLDILDAYGVKATFFVTNCNEDYTWCIGEIARRGHTVGIHSATHDYNAIYQSEEAYFADLCTGSGCIAVSTLAERADTRALALDFSEGALALAQENAVHNGVADRVEFRRADLLTLAPQSLGRFDAILSNPPYIRSDVIPGLSDEVRHEPRMALDGGADGLVFYRALLRQAGECLNAAGFCLFEIGYDQGEDIRALAVDAGFRCTVRRDLGGQDRVAVLTRGA